MIALLLAATIAMLADLGAAYWRQRTATVLTP